MLDLAETPPPERQSRPEIYLHLQLTAEIAAALPRQADKRREGTAHEIREVFALTVDRLTPLPNQPRWVMGLLDRRSRIYWMVDLADFFGLPPLEGTERNLAGIFLQAGGRTIGFGTRRVNGILQLAPDEVTSPVGAIPPELESYTRGRLYGRGENLFVLDPFALVRGISDRLGKY
jgi:twitching motility protein PilI